MLNVARSLNTGISRGGRERRRIHRALIHSGGGGSAARFWHLLLHQYRCEQRRSGYSEPMIALSDVVASSFYPASPIIEFVCARLTHSLALSSPQSVRILTLYWKQFGRGKCKIWSQATAPLLFLVNSKDGGRTDDDEQCGEILFRERKTPIMGQFSSLSRTA